MDNLIGHNRFTRSPRAKKLIEAVKSYPSSWQLIPVEEKLPRLKNWQHSNYSHAENCNFINNGYQLTSKKTGKDYTAYPSGVSILSGDASDGILLVDFDGPSAGKLWEVMGGDPAIAEKTRSHSSGKKGRKQCWFKIPDSHRDKLKNFTRHVVTAWGDNVIADSGEMLEFRYNRCQSVLPPSLHPTTGAYKWVNEGAIAHCPEWLLKLLVNWADGQKADSEAKAKAKAESERIRTERLEAWRAKQNGVEKGQSFDNVSLADFLEFEVLPRLSPEQIFNHPGHNWLYVAGRMEGAPVWRESSSGRSVHINLSDSTWYDFGLQIGGGPVQYRWMLSGGTPGSTPRGKDFTEVVESLASEAGLELPVLNSPKPDEVPFVEPDPDEYIAYQKYLEFLEFSDEQDCKRKRGLWIDEKKQSSYRRWKRSLKFTADYLDNQSQYVDKRVFFAGLGSVAVRAPMGTGKTEALKSIVDYWRGKGQTGLLIGSRNSCLLQTCQRLEFPHLLFDGDGGSLTEVQPGDFWGHCVDSLPRWGEADKLPDVLILDEVSSLLPHTTLGATCRQYRQHILKLFGEILKEAKTVYLLDANLKDWEVDFIEYLAKKQFKRVEKPRNVDDLPLKIYNFIGSYSPEEPLEYPEILAHNSQKELNKYKPNNSHFWRESFLIEASPTAVFSDSLKELKRLVVLKFGADKLDFYTGLANGILRIDGETRNFPEVHSFQSDPVRFLIDNNIIALFCSPSVESGISIKFDRSNLKELGKLLDESRDYFGGFWLYNCHLSNEAITQMLMRVRDRNVPRYLFSRTYSPVPVLDSHSEIERNYLAALNTALTNYLDASQFDNEFMAGAGIELDLENIHNQVGEVIKATFDGDLMSWHLLTQKIKAQQSYERQNLRATLLERLTEDGADVMDVVGGIGKRSLKEVNEKIAYHRASEIYYAPDTFVNVDGYEVEMTAAIADEWSKGYLVSPEKRLIGEKWLIKNSLLPGIEVTGLWSLDFLANFKFLNPDTYKQLYYRAINNDLTTFEKLKALKVSEVLTNGEGILATDIGRALPFVTSAIKTGLSSLWTQVKKVYKGEEKELKEIAKKCTHKTNSWLFGKMGKQNLIKYLNTILSNFGYALKSTRRREGGERIREYQIEDLIETEIATKCEPLIINKYQRILEEKIARNLDFANNNPQTTDIATLEAVPRRIDESRLLDSRGTGTNADTATDTAAKSENQEKSEVKAKSTPHNPETKTQFNDGDRLTTTPTKREELETHEIATLLAHGIAI